MGAGQARLLELGDDLLSESQLSPDWMQVPARLMSEDKWQTLHSSRVDSDEPIHVKEGWAVTWI